MVELRRERGAQRTGRKHPPLPMPRRADEHERQSPWQGRDFAAVVHDDEVGAGVDRGAGPGRTIAGNDGRRDAGEEQRLVADLRGAMPVDPHRTGEPTAIAAGEKERTRRPP